MKILIFGASGYIGGHAARHLVNCGHLVSGFARSESSASAVANTGALPVFGDLDTKSEIIRLLEGQDAVIWAAQLMLEDERRVVANLLDVLEGSERTLIFTSGTSLMSIPTNGDWDERNFA